MIQMNFYVLPQGNISGFRCSGHAGQAQTGLDIVCAAVSSALYMTANTVTDVLGVSPDVLIAEDGFLELRVAEKDMDLCKSLFMGLKLHMQGLEEQYGTYIQVAYMEV